VVGVNRLDKWSGLFGFLDRKVCRQARHNREVTCNQCKNTATVEGNDRSQHKVWGLADNSKPAILKLETVFLTLTILFVAINLLIYLNAATE
jgi:hypothetical protein